MAKRSSAPALFDTLATRYGMNGSSSKYASTRCRSRIQLKVLDWDTLSNGHVGDACIEVGELLEQAEKPGEETGLYPLTDSQGNEVGVRDFKLAISTGKDAAWESRRKLVLTVHAKYQPYAALRQKFWRRYLIVLNQYDTDDIGTPGPFRTSRSLPCWTFLARR